MKVNPEYVAGLIVKIWSYVYDPRKDNETKLAQIRKFKKKWEKQAENAEIMVKKKLRAIQQTETSYGLALSNYNRLGRLFETANSAYLQHRKFIIREILSEYF